MHEERKAKTTVGRGPNTHTLTFQVVAVGGGGVGDPREDIHTPAHLLLPLPGALERSVVSGRVALRDEADVGTEPLHDRSAGCGGRNWLGAGLLVAVVETAHLSSLTLGVRKTLAHVTRPQLITGFRAFKRRRVERGPGNC